jgi:drug/metabolite transporter (DMT)-like permease
VLISTTFLWTYLGECLVLRQRRFRGWELFAVLGGLAGVILLLGGTAVQNRRSLVAAFSIFISAMAWSAASLALKKIKMPRSSLQIAAVQLSAAGLLLLGLSLVAGEWPRLPAAARMFAWKPLVAMLYLVVAGSVLAFTAFHWLMQHEPASLVATSTYVNPMVAMLLGIAVVHERCTPMQLAGAATVLASVGGIWYFHTCVGGGMAERAEPI